MEESTQQQEGEQRELGERVGVAGISSSGSQKKEQGELGVVSGYEGTMRDGERGNYCQLEGEHMGNSPEEYIPKAKFVQHRCSYF